MKNNGTHRDLSLEIRYYALTRSGYLAFNLNRSNVVSFKQLKTELSSGNC